MNKVTFELPFHPDEALRGNSRATGQVKNRLKNQLMDSTIVRVRELDWEPMDRISIHYDIHYCGNQIDRDNFVIGCKPIQDALVHEGFVPDDNPNYVADPTTEYTRVKHRSDVKLIVTVSNVSVSK